jgi:hypothetical protein
VRLAFSRLWNNPVMDPRAPEGVELIERHMGDDRRVLVLTEPDLTTEILLRAGRANLLGISHPPEDSLLVENIERVQEEAAQIAPGTLLLTSPVADPPGQLTPMGAPRDMSVATAAALIVLRERFALRLVDASPGGLQIMRLVPRSSG